VEIATKASDRLAAIVAGYAKAVAQFELDPVTGEFKKTVSRDGDGVEREVVVLKRRQFRQVRWMCVQETVHLLQGTKDLHTREYRPNGLVPTAMSDVYRRRKSGAGGYELAVDWDQQSPHLPMLVSRVVADDEGVQYRLDQRELPPLYRCSYARWKVWQGVWKADVPEDKRAQRAFVFWLRGMSKFGSFTNHEYCMMTEQRLDNTVAPRPKGVL
jgi:hypothetical protein